MDTKLNPQDQVILCVRDLRYPLGEWTKVQMTREAAGKMALAVLGTCEWKIEEVSDAE